MANNTPKKKATTKKKAAQRTPKEITAAELARREREREAEVADLEVTSPSEWKSDQSQQAAGKLLLPSGNVCLAQNPGLLPFIEEGLIPNSLMTIVTRAVEEGKGVKKSEMKEMEADPDKLKDIMQLANTVLLRTVIAPAISPVPTWTEDDAEEGRCEEEQVGHEIPMPLRKPGKVYVDNVDINDKFFIFQWAMGGTRDLERFRGEQASVVGDLRKGQEMEGATE